MYGTVKYSSTDAYQLHVCQFSVAELPDGLQCRLLNGEGHAMQVRLAGAGAYVCMVLQRTRQDSQAVNYACYQHCLVVCTQRTGLHWETARNKCEFCTRLRCS